ncbi:hypothetical protein D3C86_1711390 [compost metagenome]
MLIQPFLPRHRLHVTEHLRAGGETIVPGAAGKREAVKETVDVDAATRVGIFAPGTANIGAFLIDNEGYTRLFETQRRDHAALPSANDYHLEVTVGGHMFFMPAWGARVLFGGHQFFGDQRQIGLDDRTHQPSPQGMQLVAGRARRHGQPAVAESQ